MTLYLYRFLYIQLSSYLAIYLILILILCFFVYSFFLMFIFILSYLIWQYLSISLFYLYIYVFTYTCVYKCIYIYIRINVCTVIYFPRVIPSHPQFPDRPSRQPKLPLLLGVSAGAIDTCAMLLHGMPRRRATAVPWCDIFGYHGMMKIIMTTVPIIK